MRHCRHNRRHLHLDVVEHPEQIVAVGWPAQLVDDEWRHPFPVWHVGDERHPAETTAAVEEVPGCHRDAAERLLRHSGTPRALSGLRWPWGNLALNSGSEAPQRNPFHPSASICPVGQGVAFVPDPRLRLHKGITRPPRVWPGPSLMPVGGPSLVGSATGGGRGVGVDGCCPSSSANSARACGANSGCPESIANRSASTASSRRPCMVSAAPRLNAALGAASESPTGRGSPWPGSRPRHRGSARPFPAGSARTPRR
jgi:hypothetical protein